MVECGELAICGGTLREREEVTTTTRESILSKREEGIVFSCVCGQTAYRCGNVPPDPPREIVGCWYLVRIACRCCGKDLPFEPVIFRRKSVL